MWEFEVEMGDEEEASSIPRRDFIAAAPNNVLEPTCRLSLLSALSWDKLGIVPFSSDYGTVKVQWGITALCILCRCRILGWGTLHSEDGSLGVQLPNLCHQPDECLQSSYQEP